MLRSHLPLLILLTACGSSTVDSDVLCGTGTHLEGMVCVADTPGLECGDGTVEQSGRCVPTLSCGPGTIQEGESCVPMGDGIECGAGTTLTDGVCVAETGGVECGEGTMLFGSTCVPTGEAATGPWYTLRIASTRVPADGLSSIPVLAIGGVGSTPSEERVLLTLSRAVAGTLDDTALTLEPFGAETVFRPCSSAEDPRCAGPAYIWMSLASDPEVEVARTQEFELLAPMGVGSVAACELQERALYFDGNGYIFNGTQLITGADAEFSITAGGSGLEVSVDPEDRSLGLWWNARFYAPDGLELREQVYPNATRHPFNEPDEPGMGVTGDGRGCNRIEGSFEVHSLVRDPATDEPTEVLISFEQFCEGSASSVLRGCVKYSL